MDYLLDVQGPDASPVSMTTLSEAGLWERRHLQEWVIANPRVLGDDVLIVTAEYDRWTADTDGAPARDRLDVLGLDATGRLVVVEIKRGDADRDIHLQAITYAALVSRFTPDTLTDAHREFRAKRGQAASREECREMLQQHVGGAFDPDLLRRPRQILIAQSFPKQVTHTAVWLSEMNLDIDLVQVSLWRVAGRLVAGFTKMYPTPEAEEFTLAPAREETGVASRKVTERTRARNAVHTLVETGLLPDGTQLCLTANHGATDQIRDDIRRWVDTDPRRARATWRNSTSKPLVWAADDQSYSPTGLANHVFTAVTGRTPDGIQGTTWWTIDGDEVPDGVDPAEWNTLAGQHLAQLVTVTAGASRDWTDLHILLNAIPAARWTTYGDLAAVIGSHPVPVGSHLASCGQCANPWRVLTTKGTVSSGFRWADPTRTETPENMLRGEGIQMPENIADPAQRLTQMELRDLLGSNA